ncbi:ornithine cyclodeaminase [Denitromonas ohlonensis]|uniref:Ornithine cyclodeaminase n=2 Tax=Denitromonas TaxID=139331 RepID=A0A558C9H9_9RHOO|nr:ornithine cyclodeaminase [Denitromonas ohlonensis]TVT45337.1 MAG: ornithine cyclodeaminase [Denitromonas halophila]TVO68035.1 ornithine cyclodeaminase [Denitromonas ohlonensis]TVO78060.1 ornithine cyclodeaminase [Denitromonas ohlonensis]TVT69883.1 MAG: ornithine cyclodeaminase [Denitromonas halophila]TVT78488.1 MAG: ornithine cyclodeaminase [Denitromonas halophila]
MTHFIDVPDLQRWLRRRGVASVLVEMAEAIRQDYLRWEAFEKAPRVASHSPVGVIELMPACDGVLYGFKYVNGHPKNASEGKLTVMAFGLLAEVDTGYPLLLSEMTLTTALRTAATSALAAQAMARPDARCMALIGNGAQSEFQSLAFHALLGIERIQAYDVDPAATARLQRNLAQVPGLRIEAMPSVAAALAGADIITTVTADKRQATILTDAMVPAGVHLNAVGGDCPGKTELDPAILKRARVVVELEAQTRDEGEIQQMPADFPVLELWQVLAGKVPGRADAREVTVFDSVGFALEDFAALRYLHTRAVPDGVGRPLALVPALDDPRDLFSLVAPVGAMTADVI